MLMQELLATVDDLLLLVEVVGAGGFSAASVRTGIPKSRLSRRILQLEERLGVCLIKRDSRRFEVTDVGQRLYEHGLSIRSETQAAMTSALDSAAHPSGVLRVACPIALSAFLVSDVAVAFARRYPDVRLLLSTTHGVGKPMLDPFDLVIHPTAENLPDSELIAVRLVEVRYGLFAAPSLFSDGEWPMTPAHLPDLPAIGWNSSEPVVVWRLEGPNGQSAEVTLKPRFGTDNLLAVQKAALAGLGIARLPRAQCWADVQAGRLRGVAPGWAPAPMTIYALYSSRRQLSLAGRAFIGMLGDLVQREDSPFSAWKLVGRQPVDASTGSAGAASA